MGFLDRFRQSQQEHLPKSWKTLRSLEDLEQAIQHSYQQTVVLFKHSVSCGISAHSKYQLEAGWDFSEEDLTFYYLDLLNYRAVSNKIEEQLQVIHQSPQIIVVKNGEAVYHTSHHAISIAGIREALTA